MNGICGTFDMKLNYLVQWYLKRWKNVKIEQKGDWLNERNLFLKVDQKLYCYDQSQGSGVFEV